MVDPTQPRLLTCCPPSTPSRAQQHMARPWAFYMQAGTGRQRMRCSSWHHAPSHQLPCPPRQCPGVVLLVNLHMLPPAHAMQAKRTHDVWAQHAHGAACFKWRYAGVPGRTPVGCQAEPGSTVAGAHHI
ncbi:hypothetical protein TNCT_625021 [Trichonephila clavata]|uniref:Uncharacterized protein n=1 Tax=Trichonephila clavata TaxID=2740835 RepID=A0A8X6K3W6_TRICU|nr:hypothetical protein TNCT_625021 [Trichonephila clavata]